MKRKRSQEVEVSTRVTTRVKNLDLHSSERRKRVHIFPKSLNQESYLSKLNNPDKVIVFGIGPAGSGKSLLAVHTAIKLFQEGVYDKIVITRPAVSTDEELGFLPGTLQEKMAPWVRPLVDIFEEYYSPKEVDKMMEEKEIEIEPLAYMRGRTFKRAYIILDEGQQVTTNQMTMILTRIGTGSKLVVTGDLDQADRKFYDNGGLKDFVERLKYYRGDMIDLVNFDKGDIQRHPVIEEVLNLYSK